jgi:hypothetical protein
MIYDSQGQLETALDYFQRVSPTMSRWAIQLILLPPATICIPIPVAITMAGYNSPLLEVAEPVFADGVQLRVGCSRRIGRAGLLFYAVGRDRESSTLLRRT